MSPAFTLTGFAFPVAPATLPGFTIDFFQWVVVTSTADPRASIGIWDVPDTNGVWAVPGSVGTWRVPTTTGVWSH